MDDESSTSSRSGPRVTPLFYGWKLVAALSVILFFTAGGGLYVFPVFIASMQEEFGWSMTQISISAALFAITMGLSNPLVGSLFARFGARGTMLGAAAVSVLTLVAYASLQKLWMLYLIALFSGFAVAGTTILPAQTLVINWFDRFRGRAMGLTMLGIGVGGFLLPPFNELMIRLVGWRMAWVVAAMFFVVVVVPLIAIFVRTGPSELGLLVDGAEPDDLSDTATPITGLSVKSAVATSAFWLLVAIFVLQLIGVSAMNFHFVPFATQQMRFDPQDAAFYYGLTVGFSIAGRLLFGWLADRWPPAQLLALTFVLLALGPMLIELLLLRLQLGDVRFLLLYAASFGIGIGANAVTMPVLVGRCFGELHFSRIMGLLMSGFAVGIIVGIPGAGFIFDRTGSYEWVFIVCSAGLLVAAALCLLIRPDRIPRSD
jgi:MFS family permease